MLVKSKWKWTGYVARMDTNRCTRRMKCKPWMGKWYADIKKNNWQKLENKNPKEKRMEIIGGTYVYMCTENAG